MITLPNKCLRKYEDCKPLAQIESDDGFSFICCGLNSGVRVKNDFFTHCWKNAEVDELSHWDERDIKDTISVLSQALSIEENMRDG